MTPRCSLFRRAGRTLALGLALGAGAASGADAVGAQTVVAQAGGPAVTPPWLRARLDGRFDPRVRAALERVIDSALVAGVPAEPLVDKALEGASKGASPDAVLRAVRGLASDLAAARQLLGSNSLVGELSAGASALRAGVDPGALRNLRRDRPGQPLVVALGVLTDLIARGVPADGASRSVLALTKAGIVDEQLVAFRREVERDIGVGAPPAVAVGVRTSFLTSRGPAEGGIGGPGGGGPSSAGGKRRP
jgi:hypothetical protein